LQLYDQSKTSLQLYDDVKRMIQKSFIA